MKIRVLYTVILCASVALATPAVSAMETESLDNLRQQVENYLYDHFKEKLAEQPETDPKDLTIAIGRLDSRLRLHQCQQQLTFELLDNGKPGGNVSVRTRCDGAPSWSIFVQAQVNFSLSVLVARHSLSRGLILQPTDLEQRAVSQKELTQDYITESTQVVGKQLNRPIQQGRALRLAMLLEPKVIKRGDAVIVEAKAGNIYVAAPGTALSDGKMGQQIRVKNERSNREIKVEVVGPGRVRVLM